MIGENIKAAREAKGLTQEELGNKIGVTGVTIMRYEKNQRKPNIDVLFRLSDVLDVSVTALAGVEEEPLPDEAFEQLYGSIDPITKINSSLEFMSTEDQERIVSFIETLSRKDDSKPWPKASKLEILQMATKKFQSDEDRIRAFYGCLNTDGMLMAGECFLSHLKPEDTKDVADYVERLANTPQYQRPQDK